MELNDHQQRYARSRIFCMIHCGIEEDPEDKVCCFDGGLRHEIQDIVDYKDFNTTNQLFELAMLVEK